MKQLKKNNFKGITMLELVTALIIIGILGALVYPRFTLLMEKIKADGQLVVLTSLYDAQQRYRLSNRNEWFVGGNHDQLGIEIKTSEHFYDPALGCGTPATCDPNFAPLGTVVFCDSSGDFPYLVRAQRNGPAPFNYTLYLLQDGRPACIAPFDTCSTICKDLGFTSLEDM